jgi:hypothetical protein
LMIQIVCYKEGSIFIGFHQDCCGPLGDNHREYEGGYNEYDKTRISEEFDESEPSCIGSDVFYTLIHVIIEELPLQGNY